MKTFKRGKQGWSPAEATPLEAAQIRIQQLENDLAAAKLREARLIDTGDNLRREHAQQSNALIYAHRERDEWKAAFQTVSRLVK